MAMPTLTGNRERARVLYDGQCALCCKSVDLLRRLDWLKRLDFADARDPANLPPGTDVAQFLEEMHLQPPSRSRLYHGFEAFRWMAWRLPLLWPLAPLLYLPGVPWLGQRLYLWVARNRFRLVPCHGGVCQVQRMKSQG
jgi:predicted DCC family thiol-disulfide oxidoreductase YuxK